MSTLLGELGVVTKSKAAAAPLKLKIVVFLKTRREELRLVFNLVLTPIVTVTKNSVIAKESIESDHQWNRMVRLELIPHPNLKNLNNRKAIEYEYGMEDGTLTLQVRAAVAGYWLRMWNVDSSPEHTLDGKNYQLCLANPKTLYDVDNALLAPGFNA